MRAENQPESYGTFSPCASVAHESANSIPRQAVAAASWRLPTVQTRRRHGPRHRVRVPARRSPRRGRSHHCSHCPPEHRRSPGRWSGRRCSECCGSHSALLVGVDFDDRACANAEETKCPVDGPWRPAPQNPYPRCAHNPPGQIPPSRRSTSYRPARPVKWPSARPSQSRRTLRRQAEQLASHSPLPLPRRSPPG
jgi:hypothetical protein